MNPNDFVFAEYKPEYKDYWFDVEEGSDTEKYLTREYMEQCMVCISRVVYSKLDGVLGVEKFFPFNKYVAAVDNDELKDILILLVNNIKE